MSKANRSIKHDKCCAWSSTTSRWKEDRLKKVNLIKSRFLAVPEFFRKQFILAIYVTHLARFLVGSLLRHPGACCWVYTEHNVQPLHAPEWLIFGTALGDHLADEIPSRCLFCLNNTSLLTIRNRRSTTLFISHVLSCVSVCVCCLAVQTFLA